jgi:hypothetical protein
MKFNCVREGVIDVRIASRNNGNGISPDRTVERTVEADEFPAAQGVDRNDGISAILMIASATSYIRLLWLMAVCRNNV